MSEDCKREAHDFFNGAGFGGAGAAADDEGSSAETGVGAGATDNTPEGVGVGADEMTEGVAEPVDADAMGSEGIGCSWVGAASDAEGSETMDSALFTNGRVGATGFSTTGEATGARETEVFVEIGEPGMGVSGAVEHAGVDSVADEDGRSAGSGECSCCSKVPS